MDSLAGNMKSRFINIVLLAAFPVLLTSCSQTEAPTAPTSADNAPTQTGDGDVQWIDPNEIQPGPVQRDSLTDSQMERVRALQKVFMEVDGKSVDQWVDNFKRDLDPDRELAIWAKMCSAYSAYCDDRDLSVDAKKDVYKVVLLRSMASEADVLQRLELSVLSQDDAKEIMKGY